MKIFMLLFISQLTWSFNLVGSSVATYGDPTIFIDVGDNQCSGFNDSPEDLMDLVQKAYELYWNRVSTSSLELKAGSIKNVDPLFYSAEICNTGTGCIPSVSTGILVVCSENGTTFSSPGKLAVALPNNINGNIIKGSIIAINGLASSKFNDLDEQEKIAVIAHEIGHNIGLGHSRFEDSLMFSTSKEKRRGLGRDDWDGATYLYPKLQGPAALCGTISSKPEENSKKFILSFLLLLLITTGYYRYSSNNQ